MKAVTAPWESVLLMMACCVHASYDSALLRATSDA